VGLWCAGMWLVGGRGVWKCDGRWGGAGGEE
jgi:hypothetical protein